MRVAVYCYNWAQWHERFKHLFYVYVNINTFCSKQDFSSKYNRLRDRLVVRLPIKWRCWNSHSRSESLVISTSTYPLQFSPSLDWNTVLLYSDSGNQTRILYSGSACQSEENKSTWSVENGRKEIKMFHRFEHLLLCLTEISWSYLNYLRNIFLGCQKNEDVLECFWRYRGN